MTKVHLYIHDLNSGIYNEREEELSRLPQTSEYVKLDGSLRPYRVDAVVEHAGSLASVYVTKDTHGLCLRGCRGSVGNWLQVYIPGVVA